MLTTPILLCFIIYLCAAFLIVWQSIGQALQQRFMNRFWTSLLFLAFTVILLYITIQALIHSV